MRRMLLAMAILAGLGGCQAYWDDVNASCMEVEPVVGDHTLYRACVTEPGIASTKEKYEVRRLRWLEVAMEARGFSEYEVIDRQVISVKGGCAPHSYHYTVKVPAEPKEEPPENKRSGSSESRPRPINSRPLPLRRTCVTGVRDKEWVGWADSAHAD